MVSIQKSSRASFTTWLVAEASRQDLPVTDAVDTPADQQSRVSALGHKRTFAVQNGMSALPLKATSNATYGDVRLGPKADTARHLAQSGIFISVQIRVLRPLRRPGLSRCYFRHEPEQCRVLSLTGSGPSPKTATRPVLRHPKYPVPTRQSGKRKPGALEPQCHPVAFLSSRHPASDDSPRQRKLQESLRDHPVLGRQVRRLQRPPPYWREIETRDSKNSPGCAESR